MRTLEEAWDWFENARRLLRLTSRLGSRYWNDLPWQSMENDEKFRTLVGEDVRDNANTALAELDDIAVFVFFSVFESIVRDCLLEEIEAELSNLTHPAMKSMAGRLTRDIEEGSFYQNVLVLYKDVDYNLVEEVNQIRQYRNWVAHGRRVNKKGPRTTPDVAIVSLRNF